jgi:pentatricopeptide repeat protein
MAFHKPRVGNPLVVGKAIAQKEKKKNPMNISPAACFTGLVLLIFATDAAIGDKFFSSVTSQSSSYMTCIGSNWWYMEWAAIAALFAVVAYSGFLTGDKNSNRASKRQSYQNKFQAAPTDLRSQPRANASNESKTAPAPSPLAKWRGAIELAANNNEPEQAKALLFEMIDGGLPSDGILPNIVMRSYAKKGDIKGAKQWLEEMKVKGLEVSACTYNTIMDACAKAQKPELCEKWLSQMIADGVAPTVVSFTVAIHAYAHRGGEQGAEAVLQRMKAAGLQPDIICYNALIHACSVHGHVLGVERWMNELLELGVEASVTTFTAAIDACAKVGDVTRAEGWMHKMVGAGLEPNVVSYSSLMDACAKAGDPERAGHWYDEMLKVGVVPNSHSFGAAIHACAQKADAATAEQWLVRAQAAGMEDPVLYSSVINVCGKANDAERAWGIFEHMRTRGVRPHIVLYAALARPFAHRGDYQRVEEIAKIMEESGVASNEYFLYAQLLAYSNARPKQSSKAEEVFKKAQASGVPINDRVLGVLARAIGKRNMGWLTGTSQTVVEKRLTSQNMADSYAFGHR